MDEIVDQVLSEIFVHCNPNSMRHLFKQMDTDVSGTVSKHELAKALKHLKVSKKGVVEVGDEVTAPEGWTTLCSKHAMDRLDANEDGQVRSPARLALSGHGVSCSKMHSRSRRTPIGAELE